MKKTLSISISLLFSLSSVGQIKNEEEQRDLTFNNSVNKWFTAWELVSKDIYKIDKVRPVDFVFFDDKYVYSTSNVTIEKGTIVKGHNLMELKLNWKKKLHDNLLTLPDKSVVPINLMSFASRISDKNNESFLIMPLPDFWRKSGVTSDEFGTENLVTGVFIHEFCHSQQMHSFGRKVTEYEKVNNFGVVFSDDIVQYIFDKDSTYLKGFNKEVDLLYGSIQNNSVNKKSIKEGLAQIKQRQKKYFKREYKDFNQLDDLFLTMEGLGQYSMYLWLTNPDGGNIKKEIAIQGVRRTRKWWSQDEGFSLFLILDKLSETKKWGKDMFGDKPENVTELIDGLVN